MTGSCCRPGARELARSPVGTAAFCKGRSLGLQFHAEADAELVHQWASTDPKLHTAGVTVEEVDEQGAEASGPALEQAYELFDRWLATFVLEDGSTLGRRRDGVGPRAELNPHRREVRSATISAAGCVRVTTPTL